MAKQEQGEEDELEEVVEEEDEDESSEGVVEDQECEEEWWLWYVNPYYEKEPEEFVEERLQKYLNNPKSRSSSNLGEQAAK